MSTPRYLDLGSIFSTVLHSNDTDSPSSGIVSDGTKYWFEQIVYLWGCSILGYSGIVNNIVTIAVFSKMGFKETVNISMTAIAMWDLVRSGTASLTQMYGIMQLFSPSFGESWKNVSMIVNGYIYAIAGYSSCLLASYVAIERCLCVSLPFTVRFLLTRKTVIITSVVISIVVTGTNVIAYANYEFVQVTDAISNATFITFQFNEIRYRYPGIMVYLYIMNVLYPVLTCAITSVCTLIISYHLKKASKFRSEVMEGGVGKDGSNHQLSSRDRQVIRMLVVIIIVYIVCFLPRIVFYTTENVFPEFNFGRRYKNVFWCLLYFMIAFDLLNSSVNIFIFYSMSSQFRTTLNTMICFKKETK